MRISTVRALIADSASSKPPIHFDTSPVLSHNVEIILDPITAAPSSSLTSLISLSIPSISVLFSHSILVFNHQPLFCEKIMN